jgi:hypothetical protein
MSRQGTGDSICANSEPSRAESLYLKGKRDSPWLEQFNS